MAPLLGDLEYAVLLAVLRLGDAAYGVSIRQELEQRAGRKSSLGAIYTTLDRLEKKDLVLSRDSQPTAVRGGRRRRLCRLTPAGERALTATWEAQRRMLHGLEGELARLQRETGDA
ncbi:MAG: helix-turn-helix transcriptional regulator [Acidobacteriota bacterium]